MVPITIGTWRGKAIVDTRASFTLTDEYLWRGLGESRANLKPWLQGPLYMANGEEATPLGWKDIQGSKVSLAAALAGS